MSAATRHLSVGAYLDEDFCRASLHEVYYQARRLVAPSYGFDLVPVLWHCLRARNITVIRDATIVGIFLFAICASPAAVLVLGVALIYLQIAVTVWRLLRDAVRQLRSGQPVAVNALLVRAVTVGIGLMAAVFGLFIVSLLASIATAAVLGSVFTVPSQVLAVAEGVIVIFGLIVFALPVAANVWRQAQIDALAPGRVPPPPPPRPRFLEIHEQQSGNTVVYSGYWPFVGAGQIVDTWGFAQRLVRPAADFETMRSEHEREFDRPPFTTPEIVEYVGRDLHQLVIDPDPERRIPGLTVSDVIFVSGTEIGHLTTMTPPEQVLHTMRFPTAPARHYLACRVSSWNGELVTTVHIHFAVQGKSLYIEITTTALVPCDERYRVVDQEGGTGAEAYLRAVWRGVVDTPRVVGSAPVNLVRAAIDGLIASIAGTRRGVRRGYDYGARVGVRELGSANDTRNHVQTQDVLKHKRMIERRVVAAVLDFLELKGVDTNEYRLRMLTVLNAGAVNTGSGTLNVTGDPSGTRIDNPARSRPTPGR